MNEEANQLLKEIRDLQREQVENQKKSLEYVKVQQTATFKKIYAALLLLAILVFIIGFLVG